MRELLLEKLSKIGLDTKKYGLHSVRAGGASAAANIGILIGYSRGMVIGVVKMPKMDTLKTLWKADSVTKSIQFGI